MKSADIEVRDALVGPLDEARKSWESAPLTAPPTVAAGKRPKRSGKDPEKLPRGVRRRAGSLVVTFALADGTIERRSLGPVSTQYAKQQRAIFQREVSEGRYTKRQPKKTLFTVGDLWEPYLRKYRNRGGKDEGRLTIAWNHLKLHFEKMRIADVTTDSINKYIESRREAGMQNAQRKAAMQSEIFDPEKALLRVNGTVNREISVLRAAFHYGCRTTPRMVEAAPVFPERLPESDPREGFLKDEQYAVLAANATELWLRALIACAFNFGFRKGELLNLQVRKVDLTGRWINLGAQDTKSKKPRKVKMSTEVYELLRACVEGKELDDYVFTRTDGSRVVDPRDSWYSLCVASGLGNWVPAKRKNGEEYKRYVGLNLHDFRRAAVMHMDQCGVSQTVAMSIGGWTTASIYRRYNIVDERALEKATVKIEAGRHAAIPVLESDTKSDTSTYAH
jgi:integrase